MDQNNLCLLLSDHLRANFVPVITGEDADDIYKIFSDYWDNKFDKEELERKLCDLGWDEYTVEKIMDPIFLKDTLELYNGNKIEEG